MPGHRKPRIARVGVFLDISDGERQRSWIAGAEQYAVDFPLTAEFFIIGSTWQRAAESQAGGR